MREGTRCPITIKPLLKIANALPGDIALPGLRELELEEPKFYSIMLPDSSAIRKHFERGDVARKIAVWSETLEFKIGRAKLEELLNDLSRIGGGRIDILALASTSSFRNAVAIELSLRFREFFDRLIWTVSAYKDAAKTKPKIAIVKPGIFSSLDHEISQWIDEFARNVVGGALAVKYADYDRIRQCKVCGDFFWAVRIDAETCSRPRSCGSTYNVRKHRVRDLEKRITEKQRALAKTRKGMSPTSNLVAELEAWIAKEIAELNDKKRKYGIM
jgi:hypothetical protein